MGHMAHRSTAPGNVLEAGKREDLCREGMTDIAARYTKDAMWDTVGGFAPRRGAHWGDMTALHHSGPQGTVRGHTSPQGTVRGYTSPQGTVKGHASHQEDGEYL